MIDLKEKSEEIVMLVADLDKPCSCESCQIDKARIHQILLAVRKDALDAGKWEAIHALAGVSGLYIHGGDWVDIDFKTRDVCVAVIRKLIEEK